MFKNHSDAGKQLANELADYKASDSVVFSISKTGINIASEIAKRLKLPIEVLMTKKLIDPRCREHSIGVISENKEHLIEDIEIYADKHWLERHINKEKKENIKKKRNYYGEHKPVDIKGKRVIIVDDGMATGVTASLAIEEVMEGDPSEVIVATPVISHDAVMQIKDISNKIVTLEKIDEDFGSVASHYKKFNEPSDEEVIQTLSKIWQRKLIYK